MSKSFKSKKYQFAIPIAVLFILGGIFLLANPTPAQATISGGAVAGNANTDLVAGASDADYNVTFNTDTSSTTQVITVTFPTEFTITDGNYGDVNLAINNNNGSGSVVAGMVSINGVNSAVNNVVGNLASKTITVTLNSAVNFSTGTTTFRLLLGALNGTSTGATATSSIDTSADGETAQTNITGVTITSAAVNYLKVTGTASTVAGATNELTVTAYDTYGNACGAGANVYSGSKDLIFSGPNLAPNATAPTIETHNVGSTTATTFTNGATTGSDLTLTPYKGESTTVDVTDGTYHSTSNAAYDLDLTVTVTGTTLTVTTQPTGAVDLVNLTQQPIIQILDAYENIDTDISAETITATVSTANVTAAGNATTSMTSGVATFAGLQASVDNTFTDGANITFVFDHDNDLGGLGDLTAATSSPTALDVVATQLVVTTQPTGAVDETALTQQPVVKAYDAHSNTDTDVSAEIITAAIPTSGATIGGTSTATMTSGIATFSGLIANVSGTFTDGANIEITFDDDGSIGVGAVDGFATSSTTALDVVATKLTISGVSSASSTPNVQFADNITITVTAQDAHSNTDTGEASTFAFAITDSTGDGLTETSNTSTLSSGVKQLTTMQITAENLTATTPDADTLSIIATDTGGTAGTLTASAADTTLSINYIATKLSVTTQPTGAVDLVNLTQQPIIKSVDANDNIDTGISAETITATVSTANVTAAGNATTSMTSGVATFAGLQASVDNTFTDGANITFVFDHDNDLGGLGDLTAATASVTAMDVVATQLSVTTQPTGAVDETALTQQPVVKAYDAHSNTDTDVSAEIITAAIPTSGATIGGNTTTTMTSGIATFSGLIANVSGTFTDGANIEITFDDDGSIGVGSANGFATSSTTALDVVATKLTISGVSSASSTPNVLFADNITITVTAQDAHSNTDTGEASTFAFTITDSTGDGLTETSNTSTLSSGVKQLTTMQITAENLTATTPDADTLSIIATDTGGTAGTLTASAADTTLSINYIATKLSVTTQPTGAVDLVNLTQQPIIKSVDANDNIDTGISAETITATVSTSNVSATGTVTATMTSGVATFAGLQASVDDTFTDGANITFVFDHDNDLGGLGDLTAATASVTAMDVVATKLVISGVSSAAATPNVRFADSITITVTAKDAHSNTDTGEASTFAFTITDSTGDGLTETSNTSTLSSGVKQLTTMQITAADLTATTPDEDVLSIIATDTGIGETLTASVADTTLSINFIVTALTVSATTTPQANALVDVTVTSIDANSNIDTAYTGAVWMDASSTAPVWYSNGRHTFVSGDNGSYIFNDMIKFTTAEAGVTITGTDNADATITGSQTGITVSSSAPTVSSHTPADNTTSTAITVSPTVTFSEAMDSSTVIPNTVQLRAYSGDAIINANVYYDTSTYIATIDPVASLSNLTQYYVWVSGAKDSAGNTMTAYTTKATQEFTTVADSVPTISSQYPANDATDVVITMDPYVNFSEAMDRTTLTSNNIKLCLVSDASCASPITAPVSIAEGDTRAVIVPGASLSNNTAYWIQVGVGVTDVVGNALATTYGSITASNFTTVAQGDGSLAVTSINSIETYAAVAGGWPDGVASTSDGWSWTFNITVPTSETSFYMKFDNWTSGSNTIAVATNMRFYSAQSSNATSTGSAISIATAGTYSAVMTLNSDSDSSTVGRQIAVTVQARVPTGSSGGSYGTSYGVKSE